MVRVDGWRAFGDQLRCGFGCDRNDFDRFAATLDTAYEAEGRDRDAMVDYVRTLWRRTRPLGLEMELGELEVDGDDAWGPAEVRANVAMP